MMGDCPNCGSKHTRDGDDAGFPKEKAGDITVGICLECGYVWCLECGDALASWPCQHWQEWSQYCEANGLNEEEEDDSEWLEARQRSKKRQEDT
jgi:hypothetical protein